MQMRIYTYLLLLAAIANANITLSAGTCQPFVLFNESVNSTLNETICAENATVLNITNFTGDSGNFTLWANITQAFNNGTLNVSCLGNLSITQNVTVQQCNATNYTAWANSTATVNNVSFTCLGNLTTVQNVTNVVAGCNYSAVFTPTGSLQRANNSTSGLDITIGAIPQNYCYENRQETATASTVFRSDKCNNTFVVNLPLPQIQYVEVNHTIEKQLPAQECSNASEVGLASCNIMLAEANGTIRNYVAKINESRGELEKMKNEKDIYQNATNAGIAAAEATTKPWNDLFSVLVLGGGLFVLAWIYRLRTPLFPHEMPPANTAEDVDRKKEFIESYEKEKLGGGN